MKGPGTIFETEFASVVALPRRGEKSLRFAPFPVRLGSRERLLLFLGAEFKERERGGGRRGSRWSSKMERSILRCILCVAKGFSIGCSRTISFIRRRAHFLLCFSVVVIKHCI